MTEFIPLVMLLGYGYALYRWAQIPHQRKVAKMSQKPTNAVTVTNALTVTNAQYGLWPVDDISDAADDTYADTKPKAFAATTSH